MAKNFWLKFKESFLAVFPIALVVFGLILFLVPASTDLIVKFSISSVLLLIGIALFSMGAESSMIELGNGVGEALSKKNKVWFMILTSIILGFIITFAEPDLMVLADQVAEYTNLDSIWLFIAAVSVGVGIFMTINILRLIYKIRFSVILTICFGLIFIIAMFVPSQFVAIAFDSGTVTTGTISVPFLLAFGLGLSAVRSNKSEDDCFGLIALCSTGPIFTVMFLGLFVDPNISAIVPAPIETVGIAQEILGNLTASLRDVAIVLLPILAVFLVFQIFSFKFPKSKVIRMCIGFLFTYVGIVLFLTGVESGYLPMGTLIGEYIFTLDYKWIAIPIGLIIGAFAIIAEPAMHVLKKQVEDITNGIIKQKVIMTFVSIGVALSVAMAAVRALFNFDILYVLIPLYAICIILAFINPKMFTAVAFDSGGVATGSMAVSFILPMISGLTLVGGGFGTIAFITIFPILTMQILGLIYKIEVHKKKKLTADIIIRKNNIVEFDYKKPYQPPDISENDIVEFNWNVKKEKK